jgi:hypothetical protein
VGARRRSVVFRSLAGSQLLDLENGGRSSTIPGTSVADVPTSISPDGSTLAFIRQNTETNGDLYTLISLTPSPPPELLFLVSWWCSFVV